MQDRALRHNASKTSVAPGPEVSSADRSELMALDAKINAILPPQYQNCYDAVEPASMGSAGLRLGPDGQVAWDEIWTHFCDLALAGGPPHRGSLLEAGSAEDALAEPESYGQVVEEIGRGIWLATRLPVLLRIAPGWVGVCCPSAEMAAWLVRAIVVENVMARHKQNVLYLPAGRHFRLEKEIKNVVTALAKTCHYWTDHMLSAQRESVAAKVYAVAADTTLLEPASPAEARSAPREYEAVVDEIERGVRQATGLATVPSQYLGWVSVQCADVEMAVWLMRAVIVNDVLVRREENILHLPASPKFVVGGKTRAVVETFAGACRLWDIRVAMKQRDQDRNNIDAATAPIRG